MIELLLIQLDILIPAFVAGLVVLATHIPLGREVLGRGIIFLDLAIAQVAALGLIVANQLGLEDHGHGGSLLIQLVAIAAAIAGALLLYQFHRWSARIQEALIGILFMLAATGSILLLSKDPHGGERLKDMLVGQILWVETSTLWYTALASIPLVWLWHYFRTRLPAVAFYPVFAVAITLSTQLVGVYLVFASLIVPALASERSRHPLFMAAVIGVIGYGLGLVISALGDFPSGAMIAWCLAGVALGSKLSGAFPPGPQRSDSKG